MRPLRRRHRARSPRPQLRTRRQSHQPSRSAQFSGKRRGPSDLPFWASIAERPYSHSLWKNMWIPQRRKFTNRPETPFAFSQYKLSVLQVTCFHRLEVTFPEFSTVAPSAPQVPQIKGFPQIAFLTAARIGFNPALKSGEFSRLKCQVWGLHMPVRDRPLLLFANLQHCQKCLLRNVDFADSLHPLLAFLLLLEQLAFAADVAAIALCDDVLADRGHRLARDDL